MSGSIQETCSKCHRLPPPEIMAKHEWTEKVNTMFHLANRELLGSYGRPIWELDPAEVARYFVARAPDELPIVPLGSGSEPRPVTFQRTSIMGGQTILDTPGGANVQLYRLFSDHPGPVLVICDMLSGWVTWADPDRPDEGVHPLGRVRNPCHSEMVDLDGDGLPDLLIADLGDPLPGDTQLGGVYLFRGLPHREFEIVPLRESLGRVSDVRAGDFDGDGDLDLIVAEFGWRKLGSILYLENVSEQPGDLRFESRVLDERNGTIHVPVVDLNQDGHLDFVALISQEHETIVAFLGNGDGSFRTEEIYTGPHPHWGSSGIQVVDLDGDGDLDVLYTNGDTLDDLELRPYHGVQWLENPGEGRFPFVRHAIDFYYGAHRAEAGDIDGDGDLDIAVTS